VPQYARKGVTAMHYDHYDRRKKSGARSSHGRSKCLTLPKIDAEQSCADLLEKAVISGNDYVA
jgi:hypothetical protein